MPSEGSLEVVRSCALLGVYAMLRTPAPETNLTPLGTVTIVWSHLLLWCGAISGILVIMGSCLVGVRTAVETSTHYRFVSC